MAEEGLKREPFQTVPQAVKDLPHAPFVFFDGVPSGSIAAGIIGTTLTAMRQLPTETGLTYDSVVVAHLRCPVQTAKELVKHLQSAIEVAEQQATMVAMQPVSRN